MAREGKQGGRTLELMPFSWAVVTLGQDFGTVFGHHHGVFELCRRVSVFGADRPTIGFVTACITRSGIDHRFNGKAHAGEQSIDAALAVGKVGDRWIQVELFSQPVTDVFTHDGEATPMGFGHDGFADPRDGASGRERFDRHVHAIEGTLGDGFLFLRDFTDQEGFTLVAVPAVDDGGDINVDDVAVLQFLFVGDAVADDFIDAGAAALGVILIAQGCRFVAVVGGPLGNHVIDALCRDSRADVGPDVIHQTGVDASGASHRVLLTFVKNEFSLLLQHYSHCFLRIERPTRNVPGTKFTAQSSHARALSYQ